MICLHCKRLGHLCPDCDAKRNAAFAPVPEPLAEQLRRMHREATMHPVLFSLAADREIRNALPALADLVEKTERRRCYTCDGTGYFSFRGSPRKEPCTEPICIALAARREQMGKR